MTTVQAGKTVFSNWRYAVGTAVATIVLSVIYYYLTVYFTTLATMLTMDKYVPNPYFVAPPIYVGLSLGLAFIISGMAAVNGAMLVYKFRSREKIFRQGRNSIASCCLTAVASGCPVCGAPVLAVIGLSTGLALLPLQGIEIKLLSIGILALSIRSISRKIT